jgi:hypothetical protein
VRAPTCGIVVPVCNEAAILPSTVPRLLASAAEVGARLVWVCNGCTDGSADLIRLLAGASAEVIEITMHGKTPALQAGDDRLGPLFPRFYVDADTWLPPGGLARLLTLLQEGRADLVAPGHAFDCVGVSPISARIARCWLALPHARSTAFLGVVGLSEAGRGRWGQWPVMQGDDVFVSTMIPVHRRRLVAEVRATTRPPADFAGWVRMRARWLRGERELRSRGLPIPATPGQRHALLARLLFGPDPIGTWAFLAARILAGRSFRPPVGAGWTPDRCNGVSRIDRIHLASSARQVEQTASGPTHRAGASGGAGT